MLSAGRRRRGAGVAAGGSGVDARFIGRKRRHKAEEWHTLGLLFAFVFLLAALCGLVLWQHPPSVAPVDEGPDVELGVAESSVHERGLVARNVSWDSIVAEHGRPWRDSGHRHFLNSVLVYVTPWNSLGYDMAKKFRAKFTHVSPVWYQLKRGKDGLELLGRHDVDMQWIADVRQNGSPMIVPRVVLEGWPLDMLLDPAEQKQAIDFIANECKDMEYDGIVLESWTTWAAFNILDKPNLRQKALELVHALGTTLHSMKASNAGSEERSMQLHLVIPPPTEHKRDARSFTRADMTVLGNSIDGLSVMTYDFSGPNRPGPNAPAPWIESTLQNLRATYENNDAAPEVLLGLNFYGNDFTLPQGGGPIIGHQYVALLDKHKPSISWDEESAEHYFLYDGDDAKHVVFYPTLASISARLNTATDVGSGLSIWEIGQGLEYFFDLL
ncbi:hypothetical protein M758_11G007100 [Ceratodon purpureus]|nr:hypothetical protein M758_11G007100 [Ceratodon purpureus]